jgi:hypothetical protein
VRGKAVSSGEMEVAGVPVFIGGRRWLVDLGSARGADRWV